MSDCKTTASSLSEWFTTEQGAYVLARERDWFDRTVSDLFGYNAVQLGLPELDFLRESRMPLRFFGGNHEGNDVRLMCAELPFATASMDLVLLPHVLEFSDHPHQILREVQETHRRALISLHADLTDLDQAKEACHGNHREPHNNARNHPAASQPVAEFLQGDG